MINKLILMCVGKNMSDKELKEKTTKPSGEHSFELPSQEFIDEQFEKLDEEIAKFTVRDQLIVDIQKHPDDNKHRTKLIDDLNNLAIELASIDQSEDSNKLICDRLREMTGAVFTTINRYYPEKKCTRMEYMSTSGKVLSMLQRIAGRNIYNTEYPVPDEVVEQGKRIAANTFEGIYPIAMGAYPKALCKMMDTVLNFGYSYGVTLSREGTLYGGVAIICPKGEGRIPEDILLTFGHICSASLNRIDSQKALTKFQDELRLLASEISLSEENERKRIAETLHDDITQRLALLEIKFDEFKASTNPEKRSEIKAKLAELLEHSLVSLKNLSLDLCPPNIKELNLDDSLKWLTEKVSDEFELPCVFTSDKKDKIVSLKIKETLFQGVRELVINAKKHADATEILVNSSIEDSTVHISVTDNGTGNINLQEKQSDKRGGFGLSHLKEKLNNNNGTLHIQPTPGQGTKVIISISCD